MFNTGRLRPEVQLLTLSYTILAEKVLLLYAFYWALHPLSMPNIAEEYQALPVEMLSKLIIQFTLWKNRFPYPFIYLYLNPEKSVPCGWSLPV